MGSENYPAIITCMTAHNRDADLAAMLEAARMLPDKNERTTCGCHSTRGSRIISLDRTTEKRGTGERAVVCAKGRFRSANSVCQLLTDGQDNHAIAASLGISINTVEKHLKNIYRKLDVTSRTEAVHWWVEKGTDFHT